MRVQRSELVGERPPVSVPGMVMGTALGWSNVAIIVLAIALAFLFGYSLIIRPVLKSGLPLRAAIGVALAADTVSIAVMEVVDNAVMLSVPGAMDAGLGNWVLWASLSFSLAVAFAVTVPVNRWMIARGKGTLSCTSATVAGTKSVATTDHLRRAGKPLA